MKFQIGSLFPFLGNAVAAKSGSQMRDPGTGMAAQDTYGDMCFGPVSIKIKDVCVLLSVAEWMK